MGAGGGGQEAGTTWGRGRGSEEQIPIQEDSGKRRYTGSGKPCRPVLGKGGQAAGMSSNKEWEKGSQK